MPKRNRAKIRRFLLTRWKNLIDKKVLQKKIDDLVDEYIEKCELTDKYTVEELPSKNEIKWWFQEKPELQYVKLHDGSLESNYEVNVDSICLEDPLATQVFKSYYSWFWESGKDIPETIAHIIEIYKKYKRARSDKKKEEYKERLANLSLVGVVRFHKIERTPYMCPTEIIQCSEYFMNVLDILSNIGTKKEPQSLPKKIYIFDVFNRMDIEE